MYRRILVPIDLADVELAKPAIATALMMAKNPTVPSAWSTSCR